jgi:prepilin-type N-terminal cleavage/methylation domain-containing protein
MKRGGVLNLHDVAKKEARASAAGAAGASGAAGQRGFTLLEVMASLAILGMGILMVIQLFSGGLGLAMAARGHTGAVLLAREKMSETLAETGLRTGTREGEGPEGLRWEVRVSPYETSLYASNPALEVLKITVSVKGDGKGQGGYTLTSLKSRWVEEN